MKSVKFGLLSSSVLYGLGGIAQRLISLLLLPLVTRYLTPSDYGVVGLLAVLPALLLPVFSFGLSASISVSYFAATNLLERQSVIQTARWITCVSAVVMALLAVCALDWVTLCVVSNLDYRMHTLITIITAALTVLCLPLQLEQQFSNRPLEFVTISFLGAVATSTVSLFSIIVLKMASLGVIVGGLFGQIIVFALLLIVRRGEARRFGVTDFGMAKELLKHGMPMLPSFVLLFIIQNSVRWPLERAHGVDAVGLYSLGVGIGACMTLFTSGVVAAWMPWAMAVGAGWDTGRYEIAHRFTQYFVGAGFLVLLFFCLAQPVLLILTPPSYFEAWTVVGLSAAASFMMSLFSLVLPPVYMAKKVALVLISQGVAALVTIVATYMLLDLGILGGALAVFLGSCTLVIVQIYVNTRMTGYLPLPFDRSRLLGVGALICFACGLTFWLQITDLWTFLMKTMLILVCAGCLMFKSFPNKELLLKKFLKGFK